MCLVKRHKRQLGSIFNNNTSFPFFFLVQHLAFSDGRYHVQATWWPPAAYGYKRFQLRYVLKQLHFSVINCQLTIKYLHLLLFFLTIRSFLEWNLSYKIFRQTVTIWKWHGTYANSDSSAAVPWKLVSYYPHHSLHLTSWTVLPAPSTLRYPNKRA